MEPGLARVFIFPFIKKQLIIPVKELLMSLFTLAEKWLQDTPQRTYSECIHKPAGALGTTNNLRRERKCFWISAFPSVCFFVCFSSPSSAVPQIWEETGVFGACRLGSMLLDCHQICARGRVTVWHCQSGGSWGGRQEDVLSLQLTQEAKICCPNHQESEMPMCLVAPCAVALHPCSSEQHPSLPWGGHAGHVPAAHWGCILSLIEEDEAGTGVFFCLCFQHGLRLLAWSLCTPVQGKVWDSPVLENILLARFQTPFWHYRFPVWVNT